MLTAATASSVLHDVHSLGELVGRSEQPPLAAAPGPPLHGVQAVVTRDSTAASLGCPSLSDPSRHAQACGRSDDAYGVLLGRVNRCNVRNLACSRRAIRRCRML